MNPTKTIANEIIEHNNILLGNLRKSVNEGIIIGRLLIEAKKEYKGRYLAWISENLPFTARTAENYVNLYRYKNRIENVSSLTEAYRLVDNLENQARAQVNSRIDTAERTGVKPETWDAKTEKAYRKKKNNERIDREAGELFEEKETKQEPDPIHEAFTTIMNETTEEAGLGLDKVMDDVKQRGMFTVLEQYINGFDTISERLEVTHNLIKKLRLIAIHCQKESVKT